MEMNIFQAILLDFWSNVVIYLPTLRDCNSADTCSIRIILDVLKSSDPNSLISGVFGIVFFSCDSARKIGPKVGEMRKSARSAENSGNPVKNRKFGREAPKIVGKTG